MAIIFVNFHIILYVRFFQCKSQGNSQESSSWLGPKSTMFVVVWLISG